MKKGDKKGECQYSRRYKIPEAQSGPRRKRLGSRPRGFQTALIIIPTIPTDNLNTALHDGRREVVETTPELVLSLELSPVVWQVLRTEQITLAQVLLVTDQPLGDTGRAWEEEQLHNNLRLTYGNIFHRPALKPFLKRFSLSREISSWYRPGLDHKLFNVLKFSVHK